jgi:hypothetical protein
MKVDRRERERDERADLSAGCAPGRRHAYAGQLRARLERALVLALGFDVQLGHALPRAAPTRRTRSSARDR